jgi:hypothetical protein
MVADEDSRKLRQSVEDWQESTQKMDAARLDFQSKMAVLCAGSIAALVSGAVALATSTSFQNRLPAHFVVYVATAAGTLWLSLLCCTLHNFIEAKKLEGDNQIRMNEALLAFVQKILKQRGKSDLEVAKEMENQKLSKDSEKRAERFVRMTSLQSKLVLANVVLFCVGYLIVIVFVVFAVNAAKEQPLSTGASPTISATNRQR